MTTQTYHLTFKGFLSVRLMDFDYNGKHFSYHGRKLENAVNRLIAPGGPRKATTAELVEWGKAVHDWRKLAGPEEQEKPRAK
jgi:hypothetical protein